jgi:hypothetical protein
MSGLFFLSWSIVASGLDVSYACRNGYPDVAREYRESTFVFVGTVQAERKDAAEPTAGGFYDGVTYTLRIDKPLKGPRQRTVELFSENSTGRFPMTVGDRFLAFAYLESGRRYAIDNCGNSELFNSNSRTLSTVRKLAGSRLKAKRPR